MYNLLVRDRFDALQLQSDGISVLEYAMRGPRPKSNRQASEATGTPPEYEDVTETIVLEIRGSTQAQIQDRVRRLERLADRARQNSRRRAFEAVYLTIQFDSDVWPWRSEILEAEVSEDAPLDHVWKMAAVVQFAITRRYYFEAVTPLPLELSISAAGQTIAMGGRVITHTYNQNWIQIADSQVTGSLPAPLHIDIENDSTGTQHLSEAWLVNNAHAAPTTVPVALPASSMTSAGSKRWLLPAALLDAVRGRYVRAFAHCTSRVQNQGTSAFLDIAWGSNSYRSVWTGPSADSYRNVVDLGAFPLPPGGMSSGYGEVYFRVSTPNTISHVQLLPVSSQRHYRAMLGVLDDGYPMAVDEALVDDGGLDETYMQKADGMKLPAVSGYGGPLWLYPNLTQRVYLVWAGFATAFAPAYKSKIRAYYRPRRGTI